MCRLRKLAVVLSVVAASVAATCTFASISSEYEPYQRLSSKAIRSVRGAGGNRTLLKAKGTCSARAASDTGLLNGDTDCFANNEFLDCVFCISGGIGDITKVVTSGGNYTPSGQEKDCGDRYEGTCESNGEGGFFCDASFAGVCQYKYDPNGTTQHCPCPP